MDDAKVLISFRFFRLPELQTMVMEVRILQVGLSGLKPVGVERGRELEQVSRLLVWIERAKVIQKCWGVHHLGLQRHLVFH